MFGKKKFATIIIDKKLKNGNNGQSKHWSGSYAERKAWITAVGNSLVTDEKGESHTLGAFFDPSPSDKKIGMVITRVLGKGERQWDPDSVLRGNAKQLVDSLVDYGVCSDDSPSFVDFVIGIQDESSRGSGPITKVEIYK